MRLGVDTSVLVAAVHANHPMHKPAAQWLDAAFVAHEICVCHHSLLEAYAVLTRLPAAYRLSPSEAVMVLRETLQQNAAIAPFAAESTWSVVQLLSTIPAAGGASYDAYIVEVLRSAGVDAVVTYNADDFRRISGALDVVDPSDL
jgi:predicted nucleic acid-binding protein